MKNLVLVLSLFLIGAVSSAADCSPDYKTVDKNQADAVKAIKSYESMPLTQMDAKSISKEQIKALITKFAQEQFNADSAMRAATGQDIVWLESNGRNGSQGQSIFTKDSLYCLHMVAKAENTKVTLLKTNGNEDQWLITVQFMDGYHGGASLVTLKYSLTTRTTAFNSEYSKSGQLINLDVTGYPLYVGKDENHL